MKNQPNPNLKYIKKIVRAALAEDIGSGDITAELIQKSKNITGYIICREEAVICGSGYADEVFRQLSGKISIEWLASDGDMVCPNQVLCFVSGPAREILSGERTALNFMQTLSAVATKTRRYADAIAGTKAQLLDTRKTIPGLRQAEKYAVVCGGGKNHRFGLFDAFLIKENHIAALRGDIKKAIFSARLKHPEKKIEVEVRNLTEFEAALKAQADIILLDNFNLKNIRQAVKMHTGKTKLEVSGNINLDTIRKFAKTGIDYISVGDLTKNIEAVDLSMLFES